MDARTFIIGEIASTHGGDLYTALRLVETIHNAGAQAAKIQFWSDSGNEARRVNAPELESVFESVRVPAEWLRPLSERARALGLEFLATVELQEDIETVAPWVSRFKIASTSAHDVSFIRAHLPYGKPLLISTGMLDGPAFQDLSFALRDVLVHPGRIQWLHCVSGYPTPAHEANLRAVGWLGGWSDHTRDIRMGGLAVAAGAKVIEVHVRAIDTPASNPDHGHSLEPDEFGEYVRFVREVEEIMGTGEKAVQPCERETLKYRVTA